MLKMSPKAKKLKTGDNVLPPELDGLIPDDLDSIMCKDFVLTKLFEEYNFYKGKKTASYLVLSVGPNGAAGSTNKALAVNLTTLTVTKSHIWIQEDRGL